MNIERDEYLTEAMGLCWHDVGGRARIFLPVSIVYFCKKCKISGKRIVNFDFSTWEGFGILWEWFTKQNWIGTFSKFHTIGSDKDNTAILQMYINPDKFADAIYNFLKER